ncbi:hypothetical protein GH714_038545 [Hevea brasiliensis]|uniref:C2H2-type domain-containing protein n=1 Tax=Hevea brasiliensis TaxID=3981 RepID=A0A6A6KLW0_HEVBR|nr:hypothetical protein GH714_038545 [Hevea brasiliensis]
MSVIWTGGHAKHTPMLSKLMLIVCADGKKVVGHAATPHLSKQTVKTPTNSDQKKGAESKIFCTSFGSEVALQSHTKAKHGAAQ